jgi:hypothetical protein
VTRVWHLIIITCSLARLLVKPFRLQPKCLCSAQRWPELCLEDVIVDQLAVGVVTEQTIPVRLLASVLVACPASL